MNANQLNWIQLYDWTRPNLQWKQGLPPLYWSFDTDEKVFKYKYNNVVYTFGTGTSAQQLMTTHEATYNHSLIATALQVETDPIFSAWLAATPPLYTETDPIYTASSWFTTTNNASDWDTAYSWGDHALAGYQDHYTILDTLGNLANSAGYLYNNGAGVLSYATPSTSPALTSTYIGVGSGTNILTGYSSLTWNDTTKVLVTNSRSITRQSDGDNYSLLSSDAYPDRTTGSYNIAIGSNIALANITSGDNNIIAGTNSGGSISTGSKNIGIGSTALNLLETGSDNVALAPQSLERLQSGNYNISIGTESGVYVTSGSNNLFIGHRAGFNTTGSSNIFLGYQAGYNETTSNKLYIANTNTANPLIYGEFDTAFVRINGEFRVATAGVDKMLIRTDGTIQPASLADASAANNSIYYSTTASKLVYKDSGGTVNNLY